MDPATGALDALASGSPSRILPAITPTKIYWLSDSDEIMVAGIASGGATATGVMFPIATAGALLGAWGTKVYFTSANRTLLELDTSVPGATYAITRPAASMISYMFNGGYAYYAAYGASPDSNCVRWMRFSLTDHTEQVIGDMPYNYNALFIQDGSLFILSIRAFRVAHA